MSLGNSQEDLVNHAPACETNVPVLYLTELMIVGIKQATAAAITTTATNTTTGAVFSFLFIQLLQVRLAWVPGPNGKTSGNCCTTHLLIITHVCNSAAAAATTIILYLL